MDTRSNEFRAAYNQLVTAFVNFMNVVNPEASTQQATLHIIAGQLDTLLSYLGSTGEGKQTATHSLPEPSGSDSIVFEPVDEPKSGPSPAPVHSGEEKIYFSSYPELVKDVWKFKTGSLRLSEDGQPIREMGNAFIYKLHLDEVAGKGYAEIIPVKKSVDTNTFNIIANNQSEYLPSEVCVNADMLTANNTELRCSSKVLLEKVTKGWGILSNQKFVLDIL